MILMSEKQDSLAALIDSITPEIHVNLKTAVETGRWPNGERLTQKQLEHSLQAIIAYEARHLSAAQRTGYIDKSGLQKSACDTPESSQVGSPPDVQNGASRSEPARDSLIASTKHPLH